jgi:Resolvase, N terminal domain
MSPAKTRRFVAYYRVSADRQGKSGLGLDAQRKAVLDYLNGGSWELVSEHTEIETGKRADRPELVKALEACRKQRATLVIAKLDRLFRNLAFVATLWASPSVLQVNRPITSSVKVVFSIPMFAMVHLHCWVFLESLSDVELRGGCHHVHAAMQMIDTSIVRVHQHGACTTRNR